MAASIAPRGTGGSSSNTAAPFTPDIQVISDAIATGATYPSNEVELTNSHIRLRIEVSNATLAMADEATRNDAAERQPG